MAMEGSRDPLLRVATPPKRSVAEVATRIAKHATRLVGTVASRGAARIRGEVLRAGSGRRLREEPRPLRLCLGSGHAPIRGWVNVDFEPPADILIDLRYGIPVDDGAVDAIYSEHLVEHLPLAEAKRMYLEWRRVIAPSGVVRIATPDLARLVADYRNDWRTRHAWVNWPEYSYIDSPVQLINVAMHEWGHQYLYDYEELAYRLRDAGFSDVRRFPLGISDVPALRGLETREDSALIVEARP